MTCQPAPDPIEEIGDSPGRIMNTRDNMSDAPISSVDERFAQTMQAIFNQAVRLNVPVEFAAQGAGDMVVMTRAQFEDLRDDARKGRGLS